MLVAVGFLLALSAVSVQDQVSGMGLAMRNSPNAVALPVDKLYGVNARVYYHNYKLRQ